MKTKLKTITLSIMMMLGLVVTPVALGSVSYAADTTNKQDACAGIDAIGGANACTNPAAGNQLGNFIKSIINILLFIIGAVAVIMIIIGGLRYVTSNGDQGQLTGAKNTILYSVVGLVVAIMAFAIVNFVVSNI